MKIFGFTVLSEGQLLKRDRESYYKAIQDVVCIMKNTNKHHLLFNGGVIKEKDIHLSSLAVFSGTLVCGKSTLTFRDKKRHKKQ